MFVCKLRTPSCANYEHFHVYLAYRRQPGTVVTRQTYDRAPRLTRPPTAHISRGEYYCKSYYIIIRVDVGIVVELYSLYCLYELCIYVYAGLF